MDLTSRFSEALIHALKLHAAQKRKVSGAPYVSHLLRVTGIVLENGADEDEAIAAVLHDAVEDQGGLPTLNEIRRLFGPPVADIVAECSDSQEMPKPPWRERKEAYLAHLPGASPSARLVSAADKLDNVRSLVADFRALGPSVWKQFKGGSDGTLWYYRRIVEILKAVQPGPLVAELDRSIAELERLVRGKDAGSS